MAAIPRTMMDAGSDGVALRGAVVGTIVGYLIVGGIALAIGLVNGAGFFPSLGIALFAGFWGGPGFGGMLGATLAVVRSEASL